MIISSWISRRYIVPKVKERVVPKVISTLDSLDKLIPQHMKQKFNYVVLIITVKFCSFNPIILFKAICNTSVIDFMFNNLSNIPYLGLS